MDNEAPLSEPPSSQQPTSVMDVMPPASDPLPSSPQPINDPKHPDALPDIQQAHSEHHHPETKKTDKPSGGSGNAAAIFATVIIVLGLAALATYAYIKTR